MGEDDILYSTWFFPLLKRTGLHTIVLDYVAQTYCLLNKSIYDETIIWGGGGWNK